MGKKKKYTKEAPKIVITHANVSNADTVSNSLPPGAFLQKGMGLGERFMTTDSFSNLMANSGNDIGSQSEKGSYNMNRITQDRYPFDGHAIP